MKAQQVRSIRAVALLLALPLLSACGDAEETDAVARTEGERPEGFSPLFQPLPDEAPEPEDNPGTQERIDLGHRLFFEPRLSRSGVISCTMTLKRS